MREKREEKEKRREREKEMTGVEGYHCNLLTGFHFFRHDFHENLFQLFLSSLKFNPD